MSRSTCGEASVCRIGFIGTGGVATRHATVLADFPDVELVAATDVDPERAAAFARAHGMRAVPDSGDLLAEGLDAVYVCVPPFAHGAAELEIADAGVALFVEKPLSADQAVAERAAARIAAAGVPTMVGHHWRCAAPLRRARELLADRTVRLVIGSWLDRVPPVPWWIDLSSSGGPLVEQAVHVLDTARCVAGEVTEVWAMSAGPVRGGSVDAAAAAVLRFAGGAVGTVTTACVLDGKHRAGLEIVADGLAVGLGEDWLEVRGTDGVHREEFDPWTARIAADRAFVDMVRGRPVHAVHAPPDYPEALRSHRVACALARSAVSGGPESVR